MVLKSKNLILGLLLAIAFLLSNCAAVSDVKVIRLGHGLPQSHPVHKALVFMGEELKKESGGKMMLKIYSDNQLGGERECLELLQIGSLDLTKVSSATMENFDPKYKVFNLPYVFKNDAHRFKTLDGEIGQEILNGSDNKLLKGLCFYDAGSRSFYSTKKPIKQPSDLKGMKIRVMQSKTAFKMVNEMGGSPTPINWGELYSALQQGVVDGAENNPPSFYTSGHFEVCKHYTLNAHASIPDVLLISLSTWKSLSDQQQKWLQKAANTSAPYERKVWADFENESLKALEEKGVNIYRPDASVFSKSVESMHTEGYLKEEVYSLFKRIQNVNY